MAELESSYGLADSQHLQRERPDQREFCDCGGIAARHLACALVGGKCSGGRAVPLQTGGFAVGFPVVYGYWVTIAKTIQPISDTYI